jgi:anti-sigma B factor antagonist
LTSARTNTGDLEIDIRNADGAALVCLRGRLDIESSPALRDRLLGILQSDPPRSLVVELSEVPYIDCSGIATLIEALKAARNSGTVLRLHGLHDRLLHLFDATGVLALFGSTEDAKASSASRAV